MDMYKEAMIVEDFGDRVLLQTQHNGSKVIYKTVLDDFGELCNPYGLTKKSMAPYMQTLTTGERDLVYALREHGYHIKKKDKCYGLFSDLGVKVNSVSHAGVNKLKNMGYIRLARVGYVINPTKFL